MQILFFERWHPLLALRYLPVVEEIGPNETVLEVGSGSLGIGPYLRREFTGLDLDFSGPKWSKMKRVKASATKLPCEDDQFDVVVSMDMLEHMSKEDREKAIIEALRVSKKKLIIGVPVGEKAHKQDEVLDSMYKKKHGERQKFLKEQTSFGLPSKDEMEEMIDASAKKIGKKIDLRVEGNINLGLRFWMMKGWISNNLLVNIFFRKILLLAIPVFRKINAEPVYRLIFFIQIE